MKPKFEVLNSKGEPIILNSMEQKVANYVEGVANALGFEVDITTLTSIIKQISEQKFFKIAPADYMPVRVGEGAWSTQLLTYRSFQIGDDFETGVIDTGADDSRMAEVGAGVEPVTVPVKNWAKKIGYSLFDLQFAQKAGNWDLVTAKEESRKTNWDLGIQRTSFLGLKTNTNIKGFLNQSDVTVNTSLMTAPLNTMTAAQLNAWAAAVLGAYRSNAAFTAYPTHFSIPEDVYNGLASQVDPSFPIKTKLAMLREIFGEITQNRNFKILPLAYAIPAQSGGALSFPRYVLSNYDEKSGRVDLPVDYTSTLANSIDNFNFQNVGYGQFGGYKAYRPKEMLYLDDQT